MNPQFPQQAGAPPQQQGIDPSNLGFPGAPASQAPIANPIKTNPNSTQNALLISEIRDGIVIMNDGSFRAVVMCKSINFDLMSPQEREGVEYSFQGFLNSLYFPIQIFIRSTKIDIRPYIEKLGQNSLRARQHATSVPDGRLHRFYFKCCPTNQHYGQKILRGCAVFPSYGCRQHQRSKQRII